MTPPRLATSNLVFSLYCSVAVAGLMLEAPRAFAQQDAGGAVAPANETPEQKAAREKSGGK